ncbi:hypothetical protein [Corynebacterium macclintockiae]|uniref:hypothetical protein n=1 Tax=Corynebacterium macclintockiae TaxID=2913501 RepID=UPI003EB955E6
MQNFIGYIFHLHKMPGQSVLLGDDLGHTFSFCNFSDISFLLSPLPKSQFSATAKQLFCSYIFAEIRADTPRPPLAGERIGGGRGYSAVIGLTNLDSKKPGAIDPNTKKAPGEKLSRRFA